MLVKKIAIGVFAFALMTTPSFAQNYQPERENIQVKLDEVARKVEDSLASISINVEQIAVNFPEYQSAVGNFRAQLDATGDLFSQRMKNIADYISESLSQEYSELEAVEKLYANNKNDALKLLVKDKKARLEAKKKEIQEKINGDYKLALYDLLSLNEHFVYRTNVKLKIHPGNILNSVPVFVGSMVGAVTCLPFAPVCAAVLIPLAAVSFASHVSDHADSERFTFEVTDSSGSTFYVNDRKEIKEMEEGYADKVFGICKTAGCTYLMAETYNNYLKAAFDFNETMKLVEGLKIKKVSVSEGKVEKVIKKMARIYAKKQPIGIFTH